MILVYFGILIIGVCIAIFGLDQIAKLQSSERDNRRGIFKIRLGIVIAIICVILMLLS